LRTLSFSLFGRHLQEGNAGDLNLQVNSIQKRAGEFVPVFLNLVRGAGAFMPGVGIIAAGTTLRNTCANKIKSWFMSFLS